MPSSKATLAAGSLSAGIIALDQISKAWVRAEFALEEKREIISGLFELTYIQNTGAAWGVFHDSNVILAVLCAVAVVGILFFRRSLAQTPGQTLALGAIVGGIFGNFIDRLLLGGVTDFLYFHWHNSYWPAFNVADSAICVGVFFYVLITFRADRQAARKQKKEEGKAQGEL